MQFKALFRPMTYAFVLDPNPPLDDMDLVWGCIEISRLAATQMLELDVSSNKGSAENGPACIATRRTTNMEGIAVTKQATHQKYTFKCS